MQLRLNGPAQMGYRSFNNQGGYCGHQLTEKQAGHQQRFETVNEPPPMWSAIPKLTQPKVLFRPYSNRGGNFNGQDQAGYRFRPNPSVDSVGDYQVIATGTNGCSAVAAVTVVADLGVPGIMVSGGILSCLVTKTTVHCDSDCPGCKSPGLGQEDSNPIWQQIPFPCLEHTQQRCLAQTAAHLRLL